MPLLSDCTPGGFYVHSALRCSTFLFCTSSGYLDWRSSSKFFVTKTTRPSHTQKTYLDTTKCRSEQKGSPIQKHQLQNGLNESINALLPVQRTLVLRLQTSLPSLRSGCSAPSSFFFQRVITEKQVLGLVSLCPIAPTHKPVLRNQVH